MDPRRLHFIVTNILLIVILAACAQSTASSPSATTSSTAASSPFPTTGSTATSSPSGSTGSTATSSPSGSTGSITASGACTNAYYPVPSGASWSYASSGSTSVGDYTYTRTVSAVSDAGFTTSDQYSTGVNWVVKWTCQDGNLAALDTGPGTASMKTSNVNMTTGSATADGYNIPATFDTGKTWSEKVTLNETANSNGKSANSQIVAQINCSAGGAATITVPAGKFDTVTATCNKTVTVSAIIQGKTMQLATNTENITYSYAKGVGFVKSVAAGGTDNETIVLTQYKVK